MKSEKEILLEHYANRNVHYYDQYDGWLGVEPGDFVVVPDDDGDALTGIEAAELRSGMYPVRIQILSGTPANDAKRLVRKLASWIESHYCENLEGQRPRDPRALGTAIWAKQE